MFEQLYNQLREAAEDGGTSSCHRVAEIALEAEDSEIIFPAYAALTTWGKVGLDLIVQTAISGAKLKHKSVAFTTLASLGVLEQIPGVGWPVIGTRFAEYVNGKLDEGDIRPLAQRALHNLIVATSDYELLMAVSQSHMHLVAHPGVAGALVSAISGKWLGFGDAAIDLYAELMLSHAHDEPSFQAFFCRYPQFLDPIAKQVWDRPNFHGALVPDFVIRRADDTYLVVEIETPGKLLLTKEGQLSSKAIQAEKQVLDYETFLSERVAEARSHFSGFSRADCLVVVGLEDGLTNDQRQSLKMANARRQNLRIVGFDWLAERARRIVSNVSDGKIEVIAGHRVR